MLPRQRQTYILGRVREDGGVRVTLYVCNDRPLRAWVLGFGGDARVIQPLALAQDVFETASAMRRVYMRSEAPARIEELRRRA